MSTPSCCQLLCRHQTDVHVPRGHHPAQGQARGLGLTPHILHRARLCGNRSVCVVQASVHPRRLASGSAALKPADVKGWGIYVHRKGPRPREKQLLLWTSLPVWRSLASISPGQGWVSTHMGGAGRAVLQPGPDPATQGPFPVPQQTPTYQQAAPRGEWKPAAAPPGTALTGRDCVRV